MFENANPQNQKLNPAGAPQASPAPRPPVPPASGMPVKPEGVEDIFSQMEGGDKARPPELRPKSNITPPQTPEAEHAAIRHEDDKKKLAIAGIGLGGLILIFVGLWYSYNIFLPGRQEKKNTGAENAQIQEADNTNTAGNETDSANTLTPENLIGADVLKEQQAKTNQAVTGTESEEPDDTADSDNDGLTNTEEKSLGTDADKLDTDGDGLFDKEEVYTYKTDPLNPDTDGDSYEDGSEVRGGYDPKGPGKLYEVKPQ